MTEKVPPVTTIWEKLKSVVLPVPLIAKVPVPPLVNVVEAVGVPGESKSPLKVTVVEPATLMVRLVAPPARVRLPVKVRSPVPVVSPKVIAPPPVLRLTVLDNVRAEAPDAAKTVLVDVLLLIIVPFAPTAVAEPTRSLPAAMSKLPEKVLATLRISVPAPFLTIPKLAPEITPLIVRL